MHCQKLKARRTRRLLMVSFGIAEVLAALLFYCVDRLSTAITPEPDYARVFVETIAEQYHLAAELPVVITEENSLTRLEKFGQLGPGSKEIRVDQASNYQENFRQMRLKAIVAECSVLEDRKAMCLTIYRRLGPAEQPFFQKSLDPKTSLKTFGQIPKGRLVPLAVYQSQIAVRELAGWYKGGGKPKSLEEFYAGVSPLVWHREGFIPTFRGIKPQEAAALLYKRLDAGREARRRIAMLLFLPLGILILLDGVTRLRADFRELRMTMQQACARIAHSPDWQTTWGLRAFLFCDLSALCEREKVRACQQAETTQAAITAARKQRHLMRRKLQAAAGGLGQPHLTRVEQLTGYYQSLAQAAGRPSAETERFALSVRDAEAPRGQIRLLLGAIRQLENALEPEAATPISTRPSGQCSAGRLADQPPIADDGLPILRPDELRQFLDGSVDPVMVATIANVLLGPGAAVGRFGSHGRSETFVRLHVQERYAEGSIPPHEVNRRFDRTLRRLVGMGVLRELHEDQAFVYSVEPKPRQAKTPQAEELIKHILRAKSKRR